MRSCGGLIESLLLVVENVIGKNDIDCKVSVVVVVVATLVTCNWEHSVLKRSKFGAKTLVELTIRLFLLGNLISTNIFRQEIYGNLRANFEQFRVKI